MDKKQYDYLIVGSGLYGATFAQQMTSKGKKCLVIDRRSHIGGNIYCEKIEGINVHTYGAHIFHTSDKKVWDFVNSFVEFNHYINSPIVNYKDKLYNLPFNMNTFYALWGIKTPKEAEAMIKKQKEESKIINPSNLEEQAISLVGKDIYEIFIKGYTEKQWGRSCSELPAFIINRLPVRYTFNNNYFNDKYQGIPIDGYNTLIQRLLSGIDTRCNIDYFSDKDYFYNLADKIVFTGQIDEYFDYRFGKLDYRVVKFETEVINCENYQGNAVVNYTDKSTPYTRIIEHKHFEFGTQPQTVISKEYSSEWKIGSDPFYPINDRKNTELYSKYLELSKFDSKLLLGGRLAEYKYYDMDKIIKKALYDSGKELIK